MATVEDILMTKGPDVLVAAPQTTVRQAVEMMAQANVGSVIVQGDGQADGIFTERDVVRRVVGVRRDPDGTTLGEVMSSPVQTVPLGESSDRCRELLVDGHIRHLAVLEQGALVGVVSFRDLLTADRLEALTVVSDPWDDVPTD